MARAWARGLCDRFLHDGGDFENRREARGRHRVWSMVNDALGGSEGEAQLRVEGSGPRLEEWWFYMPHKGIVGFSGLLRYLAMVVVGGEVEMGCDSLERHDRKAYDWMDLEQAWNGICPATYISGNQHDPTGNCLDRI